MHLLGINPVILLASALVAAKGVIPESAGEHGSAAAADTFSNPVLWEDYPDLDVFRVGDVFYYSSSTFAYSPGAPVLRSYDLANWEAVSHSVPTLNFGPEYNLTNGARAYVRGIWASSLRYRPSTDTFYWIGCIQGGQTHVWTAPGGGAAARGGEVTDWEWTGHTPIPTCYYDCGLLIDDDDGGKMYVAYGNTRISVAELSADGLSQVRTQQVYASTGGTIEGSRMYKIKGSYYILVTKPADAEYVLKADSPFGPYQMRTLVSRISGPLSGAGFAHQGGIVNTPDDEWYYVAFMDAYPGGRIPVVAPLTWTADGWPELVTDGAGGWGASYSLPVQTEKTVASPVGTDEFQDAALGHDWEWNHNPDNTKWRLEDGLYLQTADVTTDLFAARNTLTHRIVGPKSIGTFRLDVSKMRDGDRAGAVLFRDRSAYVGVWKEGVELRVVMVNGLTLSEGSWQTTGQGVVAARGPVLAAEAATDIWLRVRADITPAYGSSQERTATFSYSTDGEAFTALGPAFPMTNSYRYFTGYRYGVFNHATNELGGEVKVKSFTMDVVNISVSGDVGYVSEVLDTLGATQYIMGESALLDSIELMLKRSAGTEDLWQGSSLFSYVQGSLLPINSPANRTNWRKVPRMLVYRNLEAASAATAGLSTSSDEELTQFPRDIPSNMTMLKSTEAAALIAQEVEKTLGGYLMRSDDELDI